MKEPNIIFLVWDACRRSDIRELNETFMSLSEENVLFQQAVAPSPWSLPSHVSFLTGKHPSDHGICTEFSNTLPDLSVPSKLSDAGYKTYGISANGYFSPEFGFDEQFDQFKYTIENTGINISKLINEADDKNLSGVERYKYMLLQCLKNESRFASIYNLILGAIDAGTRQKPIHPSLELSNGYQYSATWNTEFLESIINDHSDKDQPFFVFANYMDTHYPYYPREKYNIIEEISNFPSKQKLNETIAHPFRFIENIQSGSISESEVSAVKDLYKGEVQTLDRHLTKIVSRLKKEGLNENTLLIVTADHGEIIGENDELGHRRMGHPDSINDHHLQVPLLIANPSLESRTITQPVESRRLADIIQMRSMNTDAIVETFTQDEGIAIIEAPAHKKTDLIEQYPGLPDDFIQEYVYHHSVVVYSSGWKLYERTDGMQYAWNQGEQRPLSAAPEKLVSACRTHLSNLRKTEPLSDLPNEDPLGQETRDQLEDLGYL